MVSKIERWPNADSNCYQLDQRYGQERLGYNLEVATEMARLDGLVEDAGVVPGDRVEILVKCLIRTFSRHPRGSCSYHKDLWIKVPGHFVSVDNGRFMVSSAHSQKGHGSWTPPLTKIGKHHRLSIIGQGNTKGIMAIRKV